MRVALDTEFYNSNEKFQVPVALVTIDDQGTINKFDMKQLSCLELDSTDFKKYLEGHILISYAAGAEARTLLALGIDPLQFQWIDLYVEFLMVCNSNDRYNYGSYIDHSGEVGFSRPPNPDDAEDSESEDDKSSTPKNMINAVFKLLGVRIDSDQKNEMRDLILSKNTANILDRMKEILDYCESDTKHLLALDTAITKLLEKEGLRNFRQDQLNRGRYSICSSLCEQLGLPIDVDLLQRIIKKTPEILNSQKDQVNQYFPFFVPEITKEPKVLKNGKVFLYKPKSAHKDMGAYQKYVEDLNLPDFPKTETGKYKSDKDTLSEWGNKHRYSNGLDYLYRYNILESSLKWFNKDNKNGFFDRMGSDNRVRPYYGIFGTQTGRNAAKAKTFPLAMSSWLRCIIKPERGTSIIAADFSQQEVYVAAILSKDENLLSAYRSGDVYLSFAKMAGMVPQEATKLSHKHERNLCKSTVLGLQFGMGHNKLKTKLKLDTGQEVSDEKTSELIQAHKETFSVYWSWVKQISYDYKQGNPLILSDGWTLFQDNPRMTSVRNFPVQGHGASITKLAVVLGWERGLKILCGLHDAIYIESSDVSKDSTVLQELMIEATAKILKLPIESCDMRIDTKIITNDVIWVEEKGEKDWENLKKFLQ